MKCRSVAALAAAVVFGGLIAGTASADFVTGTFTGSIYHSYDENDLFGAGTGYDTVWGQTVTGTFSYKVGNVPANQCVDGVGCFVDLNGPDWLNLSVAINGHTYTVPIGSGEHWQAIYNYDFETTGLDYFKAFEKHFSSIADLNNITYVDDYILVELYDYLAESVLDDLVPTNFSWAPDGDDSGGGYFQLYNYVYDMNAEAYTAYNNTYAYWTLDGIAARLVVVPEPASIALFGAGLAALGLFARLRKEASSAP